MKKIFKTILTVSLFCLCFVLSSSKAKAYSSGDFGGIKLGDGTEGLFLGNSDSPKGVDDGHWYYSECDPVWYDSYNRPYEFWHEVIFKNIDVPCTLKVEVIKPDGTVVNTLSCSKGKSVTCFYHNSFDPVYYFHVYKTTASAAGNYEFDLDANIPNLHNASSDPQTAFPTDSSGWDVNMTYDSYLCTSKDINYYINHSSSTCDTYTYITVTNIDLDTLKAELLSPDLSVISTLSVGKGKEASFDPVSSKNFYIRFSTTSNTIGRYSWKMHEELDIPGNHEEALELGYPPNDSTTEILEKGDTDYFCIVTESKNDYYTFTLKNISAGTLRMDIEDADSYRLQRVTIGRNRTVSGDALKLKKKKKYYIKVTGANSGTTGVYRVSYKPLNDTGTKKIKLNKLYKDYIDAKDDVDTFKIKLKEDGNYAITLKNFDVSAKVEVYKGNKRLFRGGKGTNATLKKELSLKKGTYSIKVSSSRYAGYKQVGKYKIKIKKK